MIKTTQISERTLLVGSVGSALSRCKSFKFTAGLFFMSPPHPLPKQIHILICFCTWLLRCLAALATIWNNFADKGFAVPITRKHCQVTCCYSLMIFVTLLFDLFQCLTEAGAKRNFMEAYFGQTAREEMEKRYKLSILDCKLF